MSTKIVCVCGRDDAWEVEVYDGPDGPSVTFDCSACEANGGGVSINTTAEVW